MNKNQELLKLFIENFLNKEFMKKLSQKIYGDEEHWIATHEDLLFLVEEHSALLDTMNFDAKGFNEKLVKKQKISSVDIQNLVYLNILKYLVNKSILGYDKFAPDELKIMKSLGDLIYPMENLAQRLWRFDEDPNKHTWWYQLDACECPFLDNKDLFGIDNRIIRMSCPLHGSNIELEKVQPETSRPSDSKSGYARSMMMDSIMDSYEVLLTDGRVLPLDTIIDAHGSSGFGYMMESIEKNITITDFLMNFCTFQEILGNSKDAYLIGNRGVGIFNEDFEGGLRDKSSLRTQFCGTMENGEEVPAFGNFQFILRKKY